MATGVVKAIYKLGVDAGRSSTAAECIKFLFTSININLVHLKAAQLLSSVLASACLHKHYSEEEKRE